MVRLAAERLGMERNFVGFVDQEFGTLDSEYSEVLTMCSLLDNTDLIVVRAEVDCTNVWCLC